MKIYSDAAVTREEVVSTVQEQVTALAEGISVAHDGLRRELKRTRVGLAVAIGANYALIVLLALAFQHRL